ncbi:restriction endonuclease subunit S [Simplicispira hankyongi]|uniref:Restriction endonuclease subunit S n=1 Tax=Simplicispira hankyongi TaxID=2315688 RepID=A0A398CEU2_9BURK|nr:restriction endonuclease subunit S [Simplicispira hankyongi]RID99548.1 restriction endonuclease subunit S [Simplicispira hankyongi]
MSNKQTKPLMPKLRFPDFLAAEGWRVVPLSQLARRTKKKNRDQKITRVLTNSAEFGVVDQRDFFDKDIAIQGNLESYFIVEIGSYVYNPRISTTAPVGPISKNKIETGVMSPLYTVFKFENDSNEFYEHYFKTTGWHTYIRQASSTGARHDRMAISSDDFMAMPLPVSSPAEQQKIADCLSSLDELIAAQARKFDALKTHKKGLMQQLFPREGETQPRLRFAEFRDAGEWEETTLGAYFDPIRNGFVGTATPYYTTSEGVRYLQGRNIKQGMIDADNLIFITNDFHNRQRKSHLKTGDILMVQSGHVGECAVVGPDFDGANCHALVILTPRKKLSSEFFGQYFYAPIGKLAIFQITTGNTIKHILASELKTLPIHVPSLAEQQRIADCLTALNTLITTASQELEILKTHKKGLMQKLFPPPEVVEA